MKNKLFGPLVLTMLLTAYRQTSNKKRLHRP